MLAIIETGSKQYKISENTILDVEKLDVPESREIIFDKVLLVSKDADNIEIGSPFVKGSTVIATVLEDIVKDDKVIVYRYKKKTGYHKTQGHIQKYTRIKIKEIISNFTTAKENLPSSKIEDKSTTTVKENQPSKKIEDKSTTAAKVETQKKSTSAQ